MELSTRILGQAIFQASKWARDIYAEENLKQQEADFQPLMQEFAQHVPMGGEIEADWYEERLRDPVTVDALLEKFREMQRAPSRSARLSIAKMFGHYRGQGRPSDFLFRRLGRFLEGATDDNVRCASGLSTIAARYLSANAIEFVVRSDSIDATVYQADEQESASHPMVMGPRAMVQTMTALKAVGLGEDNPSGYDMLTGPSVIVFRAETVAMAAAMGTFLVVDPMLNDRLCQLLKDGSWKFLYSLRTELQDQVPGGLRGGELMDALEELSREGKIELENSPGTTRARFRGK